MRVFGMTRSRNICPSLRRFLFLDLLLLSFAYAQERSEISLKEFEPNSKEVSSELIEGKGLKAVVAAGAKGYPGVSIQKGKGQAWDFSPFNRIEAVVSNPGEVPIPVTLRVDNPGHWKDNPWNTESVTLAPGASETIVVFFGYQNGFQEGFALDPSKVTQLLFFTNGVESRREFVVESVAAAGSAEEVPFFKGEATVPDDESGELLGAYTSIESARQVSAYQGASASAIGDGHGLEIQFDGSGQSVHFSPPTGRWNLRLANHLEVELHNSGTASIWPGIQLESDSGSTRVGKTAASISPGEKATIRIPFAAETPWHATADGSASVEEPLEGTGTDFASNKVERVVFTSGDSREPRSFRVTSIRAIAPDADLPDWLGTRPPVDGEWIETFRDDFEGTSIDSKKWNVYSPNYWDKRSHFSRDNVIVESGLAKLRFERKTGRHNDEPDGKVTDYQTGFLDTYDKWTQRYGYFEARMKLPTAPGLWPAFWSMPDRGEEDGPQWKRMQTSRGGMEFDIMEYLTRWGPYRHNIAFHWDGYGKGHKKMGTSQIYVQTDAEGFITAGLLWLPELAVYYCNGEEVARWESPRISDVPSTFMFTHVSGGWDNDPIDDGALPDDFVIDYVRAWQREDLLDGPEN